VRRALTTLSCCRIEQLKADTKLSGRNLADHGLGLRAEVNQHFEQSLTQERNTWRLLEHLKDAEHRHLDSPQPEVQEGVFSAKEVEEQERARNAELDHDLSVVAWLEELAIPPTVERQGTATMPRTLRMLQVPLPSLFSTPRTINYDILPSPSPTHSTRVPVHASCALQPSAPSLLQRGQTTPGLVVSLDPDAVSRRKDGAYPVVHTQDEQEEEILLKNVWKLIRAGFVSEAAELCRRYGQHWRAASLLGGQAWHDGEVRRGVSVFVLSSALL
jgi:hypothetical protein